MLNKVKAIQEREGLTDGQMARLLGIPRPVWNRIKNGHRPLTDRHAMSAAGQWPELSRDLLDRATASVNVVTEQVRVSGENPDDVLQTRTDAA
jgi:hypothetical protein